MTPSTQIILSGLLTFGIPLAFAIHELIALRRRPPTSWEPPSDPPPVPFTPKPLPECLIPRLAPKRQRVLEDA